MTMRQPQIGVALLAGALLLGLAAWPVQAQVIRPGVPGVLPGVNPLAPGLPGMGLPQAPYVPPVPGYGTPSYGNVYSGAMPGYDPTSMYSGLPNPFNPWWPPYYPPYYGDPYGGFLTGQSNFIRAQGQLMKDSEKARYMREEARQNKLKTIKDQFDLQRYIDENTPTLTDIQLKYASVMLRRLQNNATTGEIDSGSAMSFLLKDINLHRAKRAAVRTAQILPVLLKRLNVTTTDGASLAVFRGGSSIDWPAAIVESAPSKVLSDVGLLLPELMTQASEGTLKNIQLTDLDRYIDKMETALRSRVNDLPTGQYIEARQFLRTFRQGVNGLRANGMMKAVQQYQEFASKPHTAQEVAEYLNDNGLKIAAASPGDEGAYQSIYGAIASFNLELHSVAYGPK
jgi:hypothetical protein